MPLFTTSHNLSISRTSSLTSDNEDYKSMKPLALLELSDDSLFHQLSASNLALDNPTSIDTEDGTTVLSNDLSFVYSGSKPSLKSTANSTSTTFKSLNQVTPKNASIQFNNDEPDVTPPSNQQVSSTSFLTKLLSLSSMVSQGSVVVIPSPTLTPSSSTSLPSQKSRELSMPSSKMQDLPFKTKSDFALLNKRGKPIKIKSFSSNQAISSAKTVHSLGTLHGKKVCAKVDSWGTDLTANRLKHTDSSTSTTTQITFSTYVQSPSSSSSSRFNSFCKQPFHAGSVSGTFPIPSAYTKDKAFHNKYATVPSKVKAYIESNRVATTSSPSLSSTNCTSPSSLQVFKKDSLSKSSPTKSQIPTRHPHSPQVTQLTKRFHQVTQLRRSDTLTPALWKELVSQHKEHEALMKEHATSFSFKRSVTPSAPSSHHRGVLQSSGMSPKSKLPLAANPQPATPKLKYFKLPRNGPANNFRSYTKSKAVLAK